MLPVREIVWGANVGSGKWENELALAEGCAPRGLGVCN